MERLGEAEEHLLEMGKSDHPICWILVGHASGYATFCLKKNVYFIEQKCRATGDRICMAIGKDIESWGKEIKPYLKFFEKGEDIQSKILEFTKEPSKNTFAVAITFLPCLCPPVIFPH